MGTNELHLTASSLRSVAAGDRQARRKREQQNREKKENA